MGEGVSLCEEFLVFDDEADLSGGVTSGEGMVRVEERARRLHARFLRVIGDGVLLDTRCGF